MAHCSHLLYVPLRLFFFFFIFFFSRADDGMFFFFENLFFKPAIVSLHFGPTNFGLAWGMISYFAALGSVVYSVGFFFPLFDIIGLSSYGNRSTSTPSFPSLQVLRQNAMVHIVLE